MNASGLSKLGMKTALFVRMSWIFKGLSFYLINIFSLNYSTNSMSRKWP